MNSYIGVQSIADYCGVERTTVYQWLYRHGPGTASWVPVPEPAVRVAQSVSKNGTQRYTYGWAPSQLAAWRNWYAKLRKWDETEAEHYFVDVDSSLRNADRG